MKGIRLEILIDDKTLQGLNSVKGNLGAMDSVYKQVINNLQKELKELQTQFKKAMSEGVNTDAQAADIQALTGVVKQLKEEYKELRKESSKPRAASIVSPKTTEEINKATKATNNLRLQFTQVARELPSLAVGPQMFFLAISNNFPMLQQALSDVRKENELLRKSNEKTVPIWKTLISSIFSWQGAIVAAISVLSIYGKDIWEWVKSLGKAKEEINATKKALEELNNAQKKGINFYADEIAKIRMLYEVTQDLSRSVKERNQAADTLQSKYPKYFENLSNEAILAGEAASAYEKLTLSLTNAGKARAATDIVAGYEKQNYEIQQTIKQDSEFVEKNKEAYEKAKQVYDERRKWLRDNTTQTGSSMVRAAGNWVIDNTKEGEFVLEYERRQNEIKEGFKKIAKNNEIIANVAKDIKLEDLNFDLNGKTNAATAKVDYAEELAEARIKAQQKLERMLIETMQDGFKKRQALAAQQLQEEIARINADEKAQLDTIKKARAAGQSVDTNAEQQVQDNAQQQRKAANNKYLQDSAKIEKEWQEQSLQSWIAYYEKYGTYAQQRVAIIQKYALKMNNTQDENEKALFTKQQEEELQSLDDKFGKSVKQMTDLFEDASKKSVGAIEEIISKYEKLIGYMTNPDSNVTKEDLLAVGFTEKDLKDLENGTIKIADITKALKELKGELKGKSPFKTFSTDLKEAFDKIKNAKGDTKAIGEGLSSIGSAVSSFTPALQQFSSDISTIFGFDDSKIQGIIGAVDGLGNTAVGIGQALSGDIVGGAMKAVSGIASVVSSLEGVFGADYSGYERLKEQYDLLNGVWDTLIDKKKEYISMSYGEEATKAGEEAKKLINDQISRYRQLLDELAGSGASIGSHSLAYRINDRMAKEDWAIISKLVGETIKESNDLWDLTADQLEKLLQDPKIVSVLGEVNEDFLTYIQDIIDAQDELEEVEKSIQEQLTQTSFENMQDSFWNALLDMEKDAEAFGDDLTKTMQKAIIKANLGKTYESQLQNWYEKFAKANQSDGINTEEYDSLREEYNSIVEAALKERNELMKVFGWESESAANAAQSGRAGAVTTITEETAGRLEGIGNAQLDRIIAMDDKIESMGDSLASMASNIAIMTENSNYLKRLEDIADNIQNMNSTGVKIKG